jgi:hypothetical protein
LRLPREEIDFEVDDSVTNENPPTSRGSARFLPRISGEPNVETVTFFAGIPETRGLSESSICPPEVVQAIKSEDDLDFDVFLGCVARPQVSEKNAFLPSLN